jgi:hypothetical protein
MRFADLKNDVVFRRIFGQNPDLLCALLNDLLGREPAEAVTGVEPVPPGPLPPAGARLPIVELRCRDAGGTIFVLQVQLLHVPGFLQRILHDACRAFVDQPRRGGAYHELAPVVAVTICDFELWPDREQDARRLARVPMLSRWRMVETDGGSDGSGQLQHVVLELPKLSNRPPATGAEMWAWIFRNAPELAEIPPFATPGLDPPASTGSPAGAPSSVKRPWALEGPYRRALDLADEATFSREELSAYERARDSIEQTRQLAREAEARGRREGMMSGRNEGVVQGKREGLREGEIKGQREALRAVLIRWIEKQGLAFTSATRARIEGETSVDTLDRWTRQCVGAIGVEAIFADEATAPMPASVRSPMPKSVRPPPDTG